MSYDVAVPFCVRPQPAAVAFGRLARNLKELKQLKSVWGMEYPPRVRAKWPLSRRWAADRPRTRSRATGRTRISQLTSSAKSRFESTRKGHTTPGSGPIEGRFFRTGEQMKMIAIVLSIAVSSFAVSAAFAPAWAAGSCKSWLATCNSRTGGGSPSSCSGKYSDCLQSGCFTEGKRYGGGLRP